jgi:hypothetical protein
MNIVQPSAPPPLSADLIAHLADSRIELGKQGKITGQLPM